MKDFSDFFASIDEEKIDAIMNDANIKASHVQATMDENDPAYVGNAIASIAFTISIELLRLYHEWQSHEKP